MLVLVMILSLQFSGVASTNLKIYPDVFMSLDGGYEWQRVSKLYRSLSLM